MIEIIEDYILKLAEKISKKRESQGIKEEKQLCTQFLEELNKLSNDTLKYKYDGNWESYDDIYNHHMYINMNMKDIQGAEDLYCSYFYANNDSKHLASCFFIYSKDDYENNFDWNKL